MSDGATLRLAAYLVREACGLDDREPVTLDCGASTLREMALAAKNEIDALRLERRGFDAGRAEERAAVVRWLRDVGTPSARAYAEAIDATAHLDAKEKT